MASEFLSLDGVRLTDSVDADDGQLDGSGSGGASWYCPQGSITLRFSTPVPRASIVFTDADRESTSVLVELLGPGNVIMTSLDAGDLADNFITGSTAEDRFIGFHASEGITGVRLTLDRGAGLEIDHVALAIPEPAGGLLFLVGTLRLARRRRRPRTAGLSMEA